MQHRFENVRKFDAYTILGGNENSPATHCVGYSALDTDAQLLAEGAEDAVVAALREAQEGHGCFRR